MRREKDSTPIVLRRGCLIRRAILLYRYKQSERIGRIDSRRYGIDIEIWIPSIGTSGSRREILQILQSDRRSYRQKYEQYIHIVFRVCREECRGRQAAHKELQTLAGQSYTKHTHTKISNEITQYTTHYILLCICIAIHTPSHKEKKNTFNYTYTKVCK